MTALWEILRRWRTLGHRVGFNSQSFVFIYTYSISNPAHDGHVPTAVDCVAVGTYKLRGTVYVR